MSQNFRVKLKSSRKSKGWKRWLCCLYSIIYVFSFIKIVSNVDTRHTVRIRECMQLCAHEISYFIEITWVGLSKFVPNCGNVGKNVFMHSRKQKTTTKIYIIFKISTHRTQWNWCISQKSHFFPTPSFLSCADALTYMWARANDFSMYLRFFGKPASLYILQSLHGKGTEI